MMIMTYEIAHAAAWDAGNRSMHRGDRKQWNEDDRDACIREFERLWPSPRALVCGCRTDGHMCEAHAPREFAP